MTTQSTIEAVERLLSRKQAVPSKLISDLLKEAKALKSLSIWQRNEIERLTAERAQVEAVQHG